MKKSEKELIIKSAIMKDGKIYTGKRHNNIICDNIDIDMRKNSDGSRAIQGFVTNTGRFVDRYTGAEIAYKNGQIKKKVQMLFSEDLY